MSSNVHARSVAACAGGGTDVNAVTLSAAIRREFTPATLPWTSYSRYCAL